MGTVFLIFEIIGTVAFAISGAMEGIRRDMDLFGILMLGLVTAVGGGVVRDVIIGYTPPAAFRHPYCAVIALVVGAVVFAAVCRIRRCVGLKTRKCMEVLLFFADSPGAWRLSRCWALRGRCALMANSSGAVLLFVGVITGIGGGILRDVLAGTVPFVFRKHVYALASILGAGVMLLLLPVAGLSMELAALGGFGAVIVLRILAARRHWNLPKVHSGQEQPASGGPAGGRFGSHAIVWRRPAGFFGEKAS